MKSTVNSFLRKAGCTALAGASLLLATSSPAATITVPMVLTGTNNWYHTNTYNLDHAVFVMSNAVLNIEAGTVIKGLDTGSATGTNVSALYITRGGKINAQGNAQNPIIFTSQLDDVTDPTDMAIWGANARSKWGSVVIFGNAPINSAIDATGNASTPKYEVYEGLPDIQINGEYVFRFGGTDANDNSGVFRYVSLRHGGKILQANKEINGLSFGAVGRGTTVEYVETYCFADDGYEFFGGTVNTKYLVSAFNDDDSFDADMGYSGTNQFWFSIQAPDKRNYGMELNNNANEVTGPGTNYAYSPFVIYNMTVLGSGVGNTVSSGGNNYGVALRPQASPRIYNAIFSDFNGSRGIFLDAAGGITATNDAVFQNTLWWNFSNVGASPVNTAEALSGGTAATNYFTTTSFTNQITDPMFTGLSRTNVGPRLDPRPKAGSPAYSDFAAVSDNGFLTPTTYRGAFGSNDLWIASWTALSQYEILQPAGIGATITVPMVLTGTNNWYRTNTYNLDHAVFVMSNAVLNIEAGTVIKGLDTGSATGTNVSALYITRGGKINAQGNAQNPIIFTSQLDDVTDPTDMAIWGANARSKWGSVVIFGNAPINSAIDATGNASTPKYEVYEGLPDIQINGEYVFRFGGTDANDNSGVFRYVSLRHGGKILQANKEINGLSFGAVGRGTTVEYVETYCFADDGYEFFGGTVNTKYLVSAFNDDDSFDADMGYSGTNQFWFSIQAPDKRNYGMELNNNANEVTGPGTNYAYSPFVIYNMTVLGSGVGNTVSSGGNNYGVALRPQASPRIYNAIFSDFNGSRGIFLDAAGGITATNDAVFQNTLWWNFSNVGASPVNTAEALSGGTAATNYFTTTSFTNQITDPMFTGLSRTNNQNYLDPRPVAGSPAESNYATAPSGFTAANYRGAFQSGAGNWAANWTALSHYGIMGGPGDNPPNSTAIVVVTPNQPVLVSAKNGGNLQVIYATQTGFSYQLQSKTNLVTQVTWDDVGSPTAGTGGNVTNTVSTTAEEKFFRVKVQ